MFRALLEFLAGLAGLEVIDPSNPPAPAQPPQMIMIDALKREVERAHENTARAFEDYEHRIEHLTKEVDRLKRELAHK